MIFCLIGHSSSGKSTVERNLEEVGYPRIISYTTRPMREKEKDGVDYHFIERSTFAELEKQGFFAEKARYRDWYYGLSLNGIDYKNKDYIVVVTTHGYDELVRVVGEENVIAIHIKVEERERIIRQLNRGDEVDEVFRRIYTDRKDFAGVEDICHFTVINNGMTETMQDVTHIINLLGNAK
ncbi:guanylate kinase [Paenibacillus agilis]|uniref:Guanylate kinase n=1 Tax=Paenibacillus agilis TaxID=3020863 RepID=A0A559IEX0_9BACL|nr:guanylate kinase [Paenibacillus agilis]TVX86013.1 guanylate kinase [Paenibacillus agilis]